MLGLFLFILAVAAQAQSSDIKDDEVVVFFPTVGGSVEGGAAWELDIHGWIYEPERRRLALELFRLALRVRPEQVGEAEKALFRERARAFLVDNLRGKKVAIRLGEETYLLGKSGANGHFTHRLRISGPHVERLRQTTAGRGGLISFQAVTRKGDQRVFAGEIHLLEESGTSVISDIDDTIKVSQVKDRDALLWNTFYRPYRPVPGMAEVYRKWANSAGAKFHYISASPWQLYAPLADFLRVTRFPAGTFHLKLFRWKDRSFLNVFGSPEAYKLQVIEPMLKRFPHRRYVLVGDSGEKDPEAYGVLARSYPRQVARILIRNVTGEGPGAERYRKAFRELPATLWVVFREPAEITGALR